MKSRDKREPSRADYKCRGKVPHASERVANIAASRRTEATGLQMHTYKCCVCKQWHLTKSAQRPVRPGLVDQYVRLMEKAEAARQKREQKRETNADLLGG